MATTLAAMALGAGGASSLRGPRSDGLLAGRHSGEHGSREYAVFVPSGYRGTTAVPLVVMLHGCSQNPRDIARGTRLNALAERETFIAVYPGQSDSANPGGCWNWFLPAHQQRDGGEPALIAAITAEVLGQYRIDARRVYLAGMSAGGAMAAIMGATYPDVYAAIGVHSGLEYRAATDLGSALAAMSQGGPDPLLQGELAHAAAGARARVVPLILFHGERDQRVVAANAHQVLAQWTRANDLADGTPSNGAAPPPTLQEGRSPGGYRYTRALYADAAGRTRMEGWLVPELGHAWSGGSPDGSYTDPRGPDATAEMVRFFLAHPRD